MAGLPCLPFPSAACMAFETSDVSPRGRAAQFLHHYKFHRSLMRTVSKKPITPQSIFQHAETFMASLDHMHNAGPDRVTSFAAPLLVITAFAAELYFKCLLCHATGNIPRGHYLHHLYSKLPNNYQTTLNKYWSLIVKDREEMLRNLEDQGESTLPRDLNGALVEGNKAFEQLRYIYEGPEAFRFNLSELPIALRRTILEIEPTWSAPDPYPLGQILSLSRIAPHLREGTLEIWLKHPADNWETDDIFYNLGNLNQNNIQISCSKTKDCRISITLTGPLGRTILFNVPLPTHDPRGVCVIITWKIDQVILYLNGQPVQTIDHPETVP
jgi:hypothetical protein